MAYQYAGEYFDDIKDAAGVPRPGAAVTIYQPDTTTLATLYTDRTKTTTTANPTSADAVGNLTLWLEPGSYDMFVSGRTVRITIQPDPSDSTLATQVELDAHAADTTAIHGIADTAALVSSTEAGLRSLTTEVIQDVVGEMIDPFATYNDVTGKIDLTDGSIGTSELADGAVTAAKVAADVATQADLDAEAATRATADSAHAASTHTLAGDVSGTTGASTVDKIKGIAVAGTRGTGKSLVDDGTNLAWTDIPTRFSGTGSPEGVVTAPVGSVYIRTDGSSGTTMYQKVSGAGNTGWLSRGDPFIQLRDYGVDFTGATDNTTQLAAAIAAAASTDKILWVDPGVVSFGSSVTVNGQTNVTIMGPSNAIQGGGAELRFTGTGSGIALNAHQARAFRLSGVRLTYSSASFTGTLLDLTGPSNSEDLIDNAYLGSTDPTTIQTATLVNVDASHTMTFSRVKFSGCARYVAGCSSSASFANGIYFTNSCHFDYCSADGAATWGITNPGLDWVFNGIVVEPHPTTADANFMSQISGLLSSVSFFGGWLGDATGGTWFNWQSGSLGFYGTYATNDDGGIVNLVGVSDALLVFGGMMSVSGTDAVAIKGGGYAHGTVHVQGVDWRATPTPSRVNGMGAVLNPMIGTGTGAVTGQTLNAPAVTATGPAQGATVVAAASDGPNLMTADDAYFTGGVKGGWTANANCTVAYDGTVDAPTAPGKSIIITSTGASPSFLDASYIAVVPGVTYTFLAAMKSDVAARNARMDVTWYNSANGVLATTVGTYTTMQTASFGQLTPVTATAPALGVKARIIVRTVGGTASGEVFHLTQASVAAGTSSTWTVPAAAVATTMDPTGVKLNNAAHLSSGSGAPAIVGVLGDMYLRTDTPGTANQRLYICTTAGAAGVAVWTGIL